MVLINVVIGTVITKSILIKIREIRYSKPGGLSLKHEKRHDNEEKHSGHAHKKNWFFSGSLW